MTTADITVRPATEHDAARLAEIQMAAWRATYRGVMTDDFLDGLDIGRASSRWRQSVLEPKKGTVHLTVQAGPDVVGFAILGPAPADFSGDTGQLYAINLHPDWWGQGIGSILLAAAEHEFIERGYTRAFLWVEKSNDRAISFYSKHRWFDDGVTQEDVRFDPPVSENRHSRTFQSGTAPVSRRQ